jgi:hypothetical protein
MADLSITAANVRPGSDAIIRLVQFGENVTAGQVVYLKSSDSKYWKADANAGSSAEVAVGIALTGGSTDGYGVIQTGGTIIIGATTVKGEIYVLSATAGGIAPCTDLTTGWYPVFLFMATDTTGTGLMAIKVGTAVK